MEYIVKIGKKTREGVTWDEEFAIPNLSLDLFAIESAHTPIGETGAYAFATEEVGGRIMLDY